MARRRVTDFVRAHARLKFLRRLCTAPGADYGGLVRALSAPPSWGRWQKSKAAERRGASDKHQGLWIGESEEKVGGCGPDTTGNNATAKTGGP